jgi:invasion protein IalB
MTHDKINRARVRTFAACLAVCIAGPEATAGETIVSQTDPAEAPNSLPGGANALSETHGDWTVNCTRTQANKLCSLSQQQLDSNSRQRLLAIELTATDPSKTQGTLALPFGLLLKPGATLQIDDGVPAAPLPFRTCLPGGCLVPLAIDEKTVALLRQGTVLKISATAADSGQTVTFNISLKGFASALARTVELSR